MAWCVKMGGISIPSGMIFPSCSLTKPFPSPRERNPPQRSLLPLPRGRGHGALLGIERVTMNTSGQCPGVFAVLDEHGAVHHGIGDALRALANAPAVVGEVMHDVFRQRLHRSGIKNGEISGHARAYQPAIINAKGRGRDEGNLAYGLLQ